MSQNSLCTSVLTIVKGRRNHLVNLIHGLNRQSCQPNELVIGYMQDDPHTDLPETKFPVRGVFVKSQNSEMPLARARNAVAKAAACPNLVFLDVDCIPSDTVIEKYAAALAAQSGVYLGEVFYLPKGAVQQNFTPESLSKVGVRHPSKPAVPSMGVRLEENHGELWGLSFAIRQRDYLDCGGMDERFYGYGGEETDFARTLQHAGINLYWCAQARCFHQYHAVAKPPLHHFDSIVRNAQIFHQKWGKWCMEYWLAHFTSMSLIQWDETLPDRIIVNRQPTQAEIEASLLTDGAVFS